MTLFDVAYIVLSGDGGILGSRLTQRTRLGQLWAPGQSTPLKFSSPGRSQTGSAERLLQGGPLSGELALLPLAEEGSGGTAEGGHHAVGHAVGAALLAVATATNCQSDAAQGYVASRRTQRHVLCGPLPRPTGVAMSMECVLEPPRRWWQCR